MIPDFSVFKKKNSVLYFIECKYCISFSVFYNDAGWLKIYEKRVTVDFCLYISKNVKEVYCDSSTLMHL